MIMEVVNYSNFMNKMCTRSATDRKISENKWKHDKAAASYINKLKIEKKKIVPVIIVSMNLS